MKLPDGGILKNAIANFKQTDMDTTKQTTGKEVLNITPGKWVWEERNKRFAIEAINIDGEETTAVEIAVTHGDENIDFTDAKAICTAVNETYGKGFRPEAMEELYKALEEITDMALRWSVKGLTPTIHTAQTALNNAKI